MYGLETEVITLHTCRGGGGAVASSRTPTDCRLSCLPAERSHVGIQSGSTGPSSGASTLEPHYWSLSLSKDPLFNMFTMAAPKPHCLTVFALSFIYFPLLLLAQNVFTVRKMLMIMLSVWCVHGEKKQNTRDKKRI